jgi:hypothetical protein
LSKFVHGILFVALYSRHSAGEYSAPVGFLSENSLEWDCTGLLEAEILTSICQYSLHRYKYRNGLQLKSLIETGL